MRKPKATLLFLLILLPFFLTPEIIFASTYFPLHGETVENEFHYSESSTIGKTQQSPSLSLLLSLNKNTFTRQEVAVATAQLLYAQTPLPSALVTWELDYPNGTLWFTWTSNTDKDGFATLKFLLALPIPSGKYTVYLTAFKDGFGTVSSSTNFTILNIAPEIFSARVVPQVVETPTNVSIKADAADFEDGTNIHVNCSISVPNSTVDHYSMTFDGALFSLSYEIRQGDPTGIYEITVEASDSEGASTLPYQLSFENAINPTQLGTLEGIVTDVAGAPISNASLTLRKTDSDLTYQNFTDENGRYIFNKALQGIYVLEASADQFAATNTTIEILDDQTITLNFVFLRLPVIWGYVMETDETPIPDALVTVSSPQGVLSWSYSNEIGVYRAVTSEEGSFAIEASALGFTSSSLTVTVHLESITQLNFTLKKGGVVKGQVKDWTTGFPIPNAVVYLVNQTYWGVNMTADEFGNFFFFKVTAGECTVRATAENYIGNSSVIQVFLGETTFVELWLLKNPTERELDWVALTVLMIVVSSVSLALFLRRKVKSPA